MPPGFFVQNRLNKEKQVRIYTIYKGEMGFLPPKEKYDFFQRKLKKGVDMWSAVWYYNQAVARDSEPLKS